MMREDMVSSSSNDSGSRTRFAEWKSAAAEGPGWAGSLALHLLAALLIFVFIVRNAPKAPQGTAPLIPIDVVQLGERTVSPPAPLKAPVPQQRPSQTSRRAPARPALPIATAPSRERQLPDSLETRLKALSRLRMPDANLPVLESSGPSDVATSNDAAPGADAMYSVRDFVRAQVLRRWSLNWGRLGGRKFVILVHVVLKRDGTVTKAEIVDRQRYTVDATFRDVALSARNAVLLSSPLTLPAGRYGDILDMTLRLDPRDTLQ